MRLTRLNLSRLTLPSGKNEVIVFDDALPGFGVRIRAGGKRTWIAQYRVGAKQRRVTLGNVEAIDPDKARQAAKDVLAKVQLGADPQTEKAEAKARASVTFGTVSQRYIDTTAAERQRQRSLDATRRYLMHHWAPLKEMPIHRVHRSTIAARLIEISKEHGPISANRARQTLSAFFGWALREGLIETNPVIATNKAIEEVPRDRVLTNDELAAIWRTCQDNAFGRIVKLLILTGQRRDEVGGLVRSEVDPAGAKWNLPSHRTKNGQPHEVPLSATALSIVTAAMSETDQSGLFGPSGSPFTGWSSAKTAFDRRLEEAGYKIESWRLHDLRRTAATRLADLGTLPHVIEAVLNHMSGHKAGVAGIYNRATYAKEKREALDAWAEHLSKLVGNDKD